MSKYEISVVCPVTKHVSELAAVHREFEAELAKTGRSIEFIYVLDGPWTGGEKQMAGIEQSRYPVRVFTMANGFGEATALQYGFDQAQGRTILTIADRPQIEAATVHAVLDQLGQGCEMVVTRREPRRDALLNRFQSRVFHGLVRWLTGKSFHDLTCGLRGLTAELAKSLDLYGDQHRFIPVLALRRGYKVVELPGGQHAANTGLRLRGPGIYVRRLLDILNIYFLTKFTRKPLRFFGLIGLAVGAVGGVLLTLLAIARLFYDVKLADKPMVLLGALLFVLGVQVMSIGLIGEIIIFLSSKRDMPETVEVRELAPADGEGETSDVVAHKDAV